MYNFISIYKYLLHIYIIIHPFLYILNYIFIRPCIFVYIKIKDYLFV